MSIKPQYECYRYVGEICRLQSQSIVECRLPGSEISGILAVHAKAVATECACSDGEVSYGGKVLLNIVYEDGDKKVCRAERGVEFFHKAEGKEVTPACFAKVALTAENVSYRREGSGLYISVIVGAKSTVYGNKQMEYLNGGDGVIAQKQMVALCKTYCVTGETEAEDEFETDYVGDILLHSESAIVHHVTASAGEISVEGELVLNICVLKNDESVCSYERLLPFKMQVPCEEAFGKTSAGAKVEIKSAMLTAGTDEEKGKSKIVFAYTLSAECYLSVKDEVNVVADAFSTECALDIKRKKDGGRYLLKQIKCTERVSGIAALSPAIDGEYTLQAAVLPKAEIVCKKTEQGYEAEGAVLANVLLCNADGTHRAVELSLPFVFPMEAEGAFIEADCLVCGLNVRRKKSGETEAEATLKLSMRCYDDWEWEYVLEGVEGETYLPNESAFSIFIPRAGEDLWTVAKRLKCSPEEVEKSNPNLQFPVKEGERIFIYRQIK